MAPTPQEHKRAQAPLVEAAALGERVVVSGMAGLYPKARYVSDLQRILYNKENPISSEDLRWKYSHPEVAQYTGNVPDLEYFDAQFFKVHYRLANTMDPMSRKILEQTFEAIYDAGISPEHISGKKVGVYIGTCFSETEKACFYDASSRTGFGIAGCSKSMFANRISYWLNAKGPSVSVDQACCSGVAALEAAYKAISHGECEAAVVGGAYLCLHPHSSVHYGRIMKISMDGKTKSFDEHAGGCAKSEAINVLFLQKAKDAKRIYAEVVHVKNEYVTLPKGEIGPRFGFYREPGVTASFLKTFYEEAGVPPSVVEYVEAFGSAVPEADRAELDALEHVFCAGRNEPLPIGSVMSNIGYGEAASGITAITKVLLGYHTGQLASNLHCESPRRDVAALREGRMRVLTEHAPFRRTYAAVNSMSVTGVNAHVLLHSHYKQKDLNRYKCNIPRLVTLSNRQEASAERAFDILKSHPIDPEELALLHNIHERNISGHLGKGYIILDTNAEGKTVSLGQRAEYCDGAQRPLWFVYSGMGSQWAGMGAQLMRIPIFAAAIHKCHKVLEPKGLDIVHIITSPDKTIFDNILHSFVGIAAVQIALTDILRELGLVPDNIIGHSVGELGCAYADGCLTTEEMILAAYCRGRVSLETPFIRGSMAAVGMGAQQIAALCPEEIAVACHNSAESCTISGPADAMTAFVAELTGQKVFAREVPCSNIAYHSRYIAEAGPKLLAYLKEVIPEARPRSSRWLSTSVPQEHWEQPIAQYSSAEYHTNNLLSPVLFEETSALIPSNAVLVEVAPHGLLQAILKRALPASATNVPLTRRGHSDPVTMLLDAIGKLYLVGYSPRVASLYPRVQFPVASGTPFLSHYVQWAHQEKWPLPLYQSAMRSVAASCTFLVSLHDQEYAYLAGHVAHNRVVVPFSLPLVCVWDTLAMSTDSPRGKLSVQFQDVVLHTQPMLHVQKIVRLSVAIHRGSGRFEVMEGPSKVASGFVSVIKPNKKEKTKTKSGIGSVINHDLRSQDIYRILHEGGYDYSGAFQSIDSADESISNANVKWSNNWVTYLDSLLQLNALKYSQGERVIPHRIGSLSINLSMHVDALQYEINKNAMLVDAQLSEVHSTTRSGGVSIQNLSFRDVLQVSNVEVTLQARTFVPRFCSQTDISTSLSVLLQMVAENSTADTLHVLGITNDDCDSKLFEHIETLITSKITGINIKYSQIDFDGLATKNEQMFQQVDVVVTQNLSRNEQMCERIGRLLQTSIFVLNEETESSTSRASVSLSPYDVVSVLSLPTSRLQLARCGTALSTTPGAGSSLVVRSKLDLVLLERARLAMAEQSTLLVLSPYPPVAGLMDLVKQCRRKPTRNQIHVIMVKEDSNKRTTFDDLPDISLAYNVLDNGVWGGEYYVPLEAAPPSSCGMRLTGGAAALRWVPAPVLNETGSFVTVYYSGINMADINQSLGLSFHKKEENCKKYGMEFSGVTESGERVMGVVPGGAAASHVAVHPQLTWPVPHYWTLEDAATVPLAYMVAYYCIVLKPQIKSVVDYVTQLTVLVHGGAGALGQAAIRVALARGWRVFTTVGDQDKKDFLLRLFPQLNEDHIGYSRNASFSDMVLGATNGLGCSVVLCCLQGDLKNMSFKCCGPSSMIFDMTQMLTNEQYMLGMHYLSFDKSYYAVDIKNLFSNPTADEVKLHALVSEGIATGEVVPLTRLVYAPNEVSRAFGLLTASNHRGRVLVRLLNDQHSSANTHLVEANSCHMVVCDSSSVGFRVAGAIIQQGIRKIHIHSFEPFGRHLQYKQRAWQKLDKEVSVSHGALSSMDAVVELLDSAARLGALTGLYLLPGTQLQQSVIDNIHTASTTVCSAIQRFVVLSTDATGLNTCIQRSKSGLPATYLDVSMLNTDSVGGGWDTVQDAIQAAWGTDQTILLARKQEIPRRSLIREIAAITDIIINDDTDKTATLDQLGLPSEKYASICLYLRDVYHHSLDEEQVPELTLQRLVEVEASCGTVAVAPSGGLATFFSHVDPDEMRATCELVRLPTLLNSSGTRDDEFDATQTSLCIVPGLEGLHARFHALAARLKLPAFVLQPGLDRPDEGPTEMAQRYAQVLLRLGLKDTFFILGYETGVVVALELAAILEEHGLTGTVFCLGAAPAETQALLERELATFPSQAALDEALAQHMFSLMAHGVPAPRFTGDNWSTRVDACVRTLLGQVSHSAQYARGLLDAARASLVAARMPLPAPRALRSRVVLLLARDARASSLQDYSRSLVVEQLDSPLAHAAADSRTPALINKHLSESVLNYYYKKNLCDTYLMNADSYMTMT